MIEPPGIIEPILKEAAIEACRLPLDKHMELIWSSNFWSGFSAVLVVGLINTFIKNYQGIKAKSLKELLINILWKVMISLPAKLWHYIKRRGNNGKSMGSEGPGQSS